MLTTTFVLWTIVSNSIQTHDWDAMKSFASKVMAAASHVQAHVQPQQLDHRGMATADHVDVNQSKFYSIPASAKEIVTIQISGFGENDLELIVLKTADLSWGRKNNGCIQIGAFIYQGPLLIQVINRGKEASAFVLEVM